MTNSDKKPQAGKTLRKKKRAPRAMHGFFIPAYAFKSCACSELWTGPTYACIDDDGFIWNCPGCADRFNDSSDDGEDDGQHG
ncbi:MAG: hypothetical protein AAFX54_17675 [Pseudomonadota bacterium]